MNRLLVRMQMILMKYETFFALKKKNRLNQERNFK